MPASTKKRTHTKRPVNKLAVVSGAEQYTSFTWSLMIAWLVLIAIFLGLVIFKLY